MQDSENACIMHAYNTTSTVRCHTSIPKSSTTQLLLTSHVILVTFYREAVGVLSVGNVDPSTAV
jgi:hypothetical protein